MDCDGMRHPEYHRKAINISLKDPQSKEKLEKLAIEHGFTWGDKPNISALIEAIAQGEVIIHSPIITR